MTVSNQGKKINGKEEMKWYEKIEIDERMEKKSTKKELDGWMHFFFCYIRPFYQLELKCRLNWFYFFLKKSHFYFPFSIDSANDPSK